MLYPVTLTKYRCYLNKLFAIQPFFIPLLAVLFLSGCGKDYPSDAVVRQASNSNCSVVSYGKFEELPKEGDLRRAATKAEMDCQTADQKNSKRLQASITFEQRQDWFSKPWLLKGIEFAQPTPEQIAQTEKSLATTRLPFADGPVCNALIARVNEALPCLEKQNIEFAQRTRELIQQAKGTLNARQLSDPNFVLQHDKECTERWSYVVRAMTREQQACVPQ